MPKRIALLAAAAALAAMPALAQQSTSPASPDKSAQPTQTMPAQPSQTQSSQPSRSFVDAQSSDQWLGSTLIGLKVSAGDENIGSISDLLVDKDGKVVAAVIGVGGFLGIGKKNVAVPFETLTLSRNPDGNEQATIRLSKTELEKAPDFKPYEAPRPAAKSPSGGGSSPGMTKKPSGM
jgi:hypothetical protein